MPSCSRLRYIESHPRTASVSWGDREPVGTLVLLHAFPLGARMWESQHSLADHGWRVVMPQFRGFDCAKSDGADAASVEDYAGDISDLLDTLPVDSVVVLGLSMGGYVAFELYRRAPHLFRALVLADTRADADTPEGRANRARMIEVAATGGAAAIADEMVPRLLGEATRRTNPAVEDRVRAMIVANQPSAIQAALRSMMTRPDSVTLLPTIGVPTLVIVGEEDTLTPPALSVSMAAAIPNAELVRIPLAGHLSSLEQPQAFNGALLSFLARLRS
jgi:pimeloyl-ACP methyl ester carboxylesterase